jgi:hypothetical protein
VAVPTADVPPRERASAALVAPDVIFALHARGMQASRLSATCQRCTGRGSMEAGCLVSYAPNIPELFRRAATYVGISKYVGPVNSFRSTA